jgi:hypothetical protein
MSERDLRSLITELSDATETFFKRRGRVSPVWIAIDANGRAHLIQPISDDKDLSATFTRARFRYLGIKRYVFIDEAWMLNESSGMGEADLKAAMKEGISNHPRRIEVVFFSGEDEDAGIITAHRRIERPAGKRPYLGALVVDNMTRSEGRMVGMLPQKGVLQ